MDVKPGILTTEFYATVIPGLIAILVITGVIDAGDTDMFVELATKIVSGIVAIATLVTYITKRTELKRSALGVEMARLKLPQTEPGVEVETAIG